jgi:hypothetical protein
MSDDHSTKSWHRKIVLGVETHPLDRPDKALGRLCLSERRGGRCSCRYKGTR